MGVNATPRVASASPYTGVIALPGSPQGTNFAVNRSMVSGLTGSAPLNASRQLERSSPSIWSGSMRRTHSS